MPRRHARAFTLIELLVVIAIIAILMAVITPAFSTASDKARITHCRSNLQQVHLALQMHREDRGGLPGGLMDLYARGYITDDSVLLCSKTGVPYHYDRAARGASGLRCSCCDPKTPSGQRPHGYRERYVVLRVGGKLEELGP